jgi:hypothetical protein
VNRAARELQRPRAERADPVRDDRGVGVHDAHILERHAQHRGRDLGPRGLVTLAVRHAAGDDRRGAVRLDAHRSVLAAAPADLYVATDADSELANIATGTPHRLLLAPTVVVALAQRAVEGERVVAGVVHRSGGRRVRERVGRDEVAVTDRDRIEVERAGHEVE